MRELMILRPIEVRYGHNYICHFAINAVVYVFSANFQSHCNCHVIQLRTMLRLHQLILMQFAIYNRRLCSFWSRIICNTRFCKNTCEKMIFLLLCIAQWCMSLCEDGAWALVKSGSGKCSWNIYDRNSWNM